MLGYIDHAFGCNEDSLEHLRETSDLNQCIDDALCEAEKMVNKLTEEPSDSDSDTIEERNSAAFMGGSSPLLNNRQRQRTPTHISIEDTLTVANASGEAAAASIDIDSRRREHELQADANPRPQHRRRRNKSTSRTTVAPVPFDEASFKEEATAEIISLVGKFDTLNCGQDEAKPIATATRLVMACKLRLLDEFTSGDLSTHNIHCILENLRCVLEGVDACRKQFANIKKKEADLLQNMPGYSDADQSRGALLKSLQREADIDYKFVLSGVAEESAAGNAIKAFCKLTTGALEAFSIHLQPLQTFFPILVHLAAAIDVLSEYTVDDLFAHLPDDSAEYIEFNRLSAELYRQQVGCELDKGAVTALGFIEDVVVPFLRRDALEDKMRAVKLALTIKGQVTNVGNGRGERKGLVLKKFRAAASRSMKVGGRNLDAASSQADYFDDRHKRAGTMVPFFLLLLANEIETKSACTFTKQGGFAHRILDLSWSDLTRRCNRFASTAFFDTSSVEAFGKVCTEADFKDLKTDVVPKETKTNVVIFNRQQMKSLRV